MWTISELEKLSTQRLLQLHKRYRRRAVAPPWDVFETAQERAQIHTTVRRLKEILDQREHLPRKAKKDNVQGKRKRGTKNARQ